MPAVVKLDCSRAFFQRCLELIGEIFVVFFYFYFSSIAVEESKHVTGLLKARGKKVRGVRREPFERGE